MRRPRMSTGTWIFTGLVCAALVAPASVYAASITRTELFGLHGTNGADVTAQHQLLTAVIPSSKVVHAHKLVGGPCTTVYAPPARKAIVVSSVVYSYGNGVDNTTEDFGTLFSGSCVDTSKVDQIDQVEKFGSIQHTFPTGLPMAKVRASSQGGAIDVLIVGYLIDASSLP